MKLIDIKIFFIVFIFGSIALGLKYVIFSDYLYFIVYGLVLWACFSIIISYLIKKLKLIKYKEDFLEIEKSDLALSLILDTLKMGLWAWNYKQDKIICNKWINEMFDLNFEDVLKYEEFLKYIHQKDVEIFKKNINNIVENKDTCSFEFRILFKSSIKKIYCCSSNYNDYVLCVFIDITEKELDKVKLLKYSTELQTFIYIISHDIKGAARSITNLLNWIEEEKNKDSRIIFSKMLKNRVSNLSLLINGLLEYSGIENKGNDKKINLNLILNKIKKDLNEESDKKVIIESNILPEINFNYNRAMQMFEELVVNSIKHHDKNLINISIDGEIVDNKIRLKFCDDGPGIPEKYHDKVFILFQKLNKNSIGAGVGLSLIKKIVDSYDGEIFITSNTNGGTCINIIMPLRA